MESVTTIDLNEYEENVIDICLVDDFLGPNGDELPTLITMIFKFEESGRIIEYPQRLEMLCDTLTDIEPDQYWEITYKGIRYTVESITRIEDFIRPECAQLEILAKEVRNADGK